MKRNRLLPSSNRKSIFSNTATRLNTRRNVFVVSSLAIVSIFVTSMVLATNRPSTATVESQVISLPNLPAEMQNISKLNLPASAETQLAIPEQEASKTIVQTANTQVHIETSSSNAHLDELTEIEQQAALAQITNSNLLETANIDTVVDWQEITVKSGDNLSLIFPRVGLSARDVYNVAQLGKDIKPLLNLKPGQTLRFDIREVEGKNNLQQLQLQLSPIKMFSVSSINNTYLAELHVRDVEQRQMHASGHIESSLFEAGIEAGLSDKLIMELAYIFGWDIDFALDL